ncbi:MAG: hypothetical protein KatS3mg022_3602 [Armatimonadota bacterium]|nr:MAG: hypothetical protein KatS3mg022_3242 [Armatimonadota bacterium]GIV18167.1 MAG: hypothetical protein KatS3mg022_3602 [Armatimonadota bacterium]
MGTGSRSAVWGFGILCFLVSLAYTGYDSIADNRAVSLAVVEWLRDPTLYPSDPIRETFPRYVSVYVCPSGQTGYGCGNDF